MAERMTFPMYAIHRQQTKALWQAVQSLLDERGVMVAGDPPAADPGDLLAHWRQPTLLLSQTCGYPLVTQLPVAKGAAIAACWWSAKRIATGCWGTFLAVGRCAMPSTRSPATTYCVKWSRRSPGRGVFFQR